MAGCAGGSAGRTTPAPQQAPNKTTDAGRFEAARAAAEEQARRSTPAGFDLSIGSTYIVKLSGNQLVFTNRDLALRTVTAVNTRAGLKSSANRRADITEVPSSFFQSMPGSRQVLSIKSICTPDNCPDPPPPPDPTPPPSGYADGGTSYFSGSTPQAAAVASTRQGPCTETVTTDNYPYVKMGYAITAGGGTWTLTYTAGAPYYDGGSDTADISTAIRLVDGSTMQNTYQTVIPNGSPTTTTLNYGGDIRNVKYALIQVTDHAYPADNVISGQASVTCPGDTSVVARVPPFPPPPPYYWLNPLGPA